MSRNVARSWPKTALLLLLSLALAITVPPLAWAESNTATPSPSAALSAGNTQGLSAQTSSSGIEYQVKADGSWQDWKRNGSTATTSAKTPLTALRIATTGRLNGSVQYQVHIKGYGWLKSRTEGQTAASKGKFKGRAIDAVRIALCGRISKTYSVQYRISTADTGWQSWKSGGGTAGSTKKAAGSILSIQVKLVKKAAAERTQDRGIVGVRYRAARVSKGWNQWYADGKSSGGAGKSRRIKALKIELQNGDYQGNIKYRAHSMSGKWTKWKQNGKKLSNKRIDAIQVKLTGDIAKDYGIEYRAYMHNIGWLDAVGSGGIAGIEGGGLGIEAVRIKLVKKDKSSGWVSSASGWKYRQNGELVTSSWVVTEQNPIDPTVTGLQRYWIDAKGLLAANRYVNPKKKLDADAGWTAFATSAGYIARGKFTNSDGMLLADNEGKLFTQTQWLTTGAFDDSTQKYRLVKNGVAAVVQTGLFTVGSKKYYGWEDGRGYIMRSDLHCIGTTWYKADKNGVLKKYTSGTTKLIERYVKWAIKIANDDKHGYSQKNRWGPDYDCSSLVCSALLASGFPQSGASWTGNMKSCLKKIGFKWHKGTSGLRRGDILLVHSSSRQHTEIYIGNKKLVGAHIAENGKTHGKTGDQTGNEISVTKYYNAPWQGYLRYKG